MNFLFLLNIWPVVFGVYPCQCNCLLKFIMSHWLLSLHEDNFFVENVVINNTKRTCTPPPFPFSHPAIKSVWTSKLICNINIVHIIIVFINNINHQLQGHPQGVLLWEYCKSRFNLPYKLSLSEQYIFVQLSHHSLRHHKL